MGLLDKASDALFGGGNDGPSPEDLQRQAEQVNAYNRENQTYADFANRSDMIGPDKSSSTWGVELVKDPLTDQDMRKWTRTTNLSPEEQAIYDTNQQSRAAQSNVGLTAAERLQDDYASAMDWSGLTPYAKPTGAMAQYGGGQGTTGASRNPYGVGGPQTVRQPSNNTQGGGYMGSRTRNQSSGGPSGNSAAVDAIYEQQMRRIDPQYDRQREALQDQLRNQGMRPEDFAWQQQMQDMDEGYNDASEMARLSSFEEGRKRREVDIKQQMASVASQNAGTASQQARWANELANNQLVNAQRQQQFMEMMGIRAHGLNESTALMNGTMVALPTYEGAPTSTPASNSVGLDAMLASSNMSAANRQAEMAAFGTLGGAIVGQDNFWTD